jgi:exopolysaccharide biosynthesis protein
MKFLRAIGRIFSFIGVFLLVLLVTVYGMGLIFCYGPSIHARNMFITTILETGQMKFIAGMFMSDKAIKKIVDSNSMESLDIEMDNSLINTDSKLDKNGIELVEIAGSTYNAKMIIVNDPARVKVATIYNGSWKEYGVTLDKLVNDADAFAGVNGGLYYSSGNKGGRPLGLVVKEGKIEYNNPVGIRGMHLVGFNEDNVLRIIDLSGKNKNEVEKVIKDEKIRDAVAFQEEASDANNHFVKLVINGEERDVKGSGSGANPRTAIGQRSDGTVLILVTDGRGANGHLGATAADLIEIMKKYDAVNAANIDGGSSSSMYYDGKYEMTSVTLYYSNSSWRLPDGFVVEKR